MKKKFSALFIGLMLIIGVSSCNSLEDDFLNLQKEVKELREQMKKDEEAKKEQDANMPFIKLSEEGSTMPLVFYPGETQTIKVQSKDLTDIVGESTNPSWKVLYDEKEGKVFITAPVDVTTGGSDILVSGVNSKGQVFRGNLATSINDYSNPYGTFVLNEGSAWSNPPEMGSLIYISPKNNAIPNLYLQLNGKMLGGATQDMVAANGKYYIIAQNHYPETDGMLTIVDAKTLKKEFNMPWPKKELDWPTHIAVLDDNHIYIRDNKGIWRFDVSTRRLTFVEDTKGARKNVMLVLDGKVIASNGKKIQFISAEMDKVEATIELPAYLSGLALSGDGNFYASYLNGKEAVIVKIDGKSHKILKENKITDNSAQLLVSSFTASSSISAKGDTIYYSGSSSTIYRHIFSTNTSKLMVDTKVELNPDHTVTYNTAQVHPLTGHVYFNTIKGYGSAYRTNTIYRFDMTGDEAKVISRYENLTRFPAGIFFPATK